MRINDIGSEETGTARDVLRVAQETGYYCAEGGDEREWQCGDFGENNYSTEFVICHLNNLINLRLKCANFSS